jgi:hypothetical protein
MLTELKKIAYHVQLPGDTKRDFLDILVAESAMLLSI